MLYGKNELEFLLISMSISILIYISEFKMHDFLFLVLYLEIT